jgi:hypothetical protein
VSGETDSIVDIVRERNRIVQSVTTGLFDGAEDLLYDAIKRRRKTVETLKTQAMQPGDKVTFNGMARPKYLQAGVIAEVKEVYTTGVLLQMPDVIAGDTGGRFEGREVRCPAAIIDKDES